jgi:preprotein translocase subunit SecA
MVREDVNDVVYVNEEDKYSALLTEIKEINKKEAPILVGTASIESSEKVSSILKKAGIKHQVLNAKYHEKEAMIIEEAGRPGAITIATNMAGRGTDIVLGGKKEDDKESSESN